VISSVLENSWGNPVWVDLHNDARLALNGQSSHGLFIWGGVNSRFEPLPNGKLYNTAAGVWGTISGTNAPTPRLGATCVRSSKEFMVWGGSDAAGNPIGTGAKYNLTTNTYEP
jgi:hypothetical protein